MKNKQNSLALELVFLLIVIFINFVSAKTEMSISGAGVEYESGILNTFNESEWIGIIVYYRTEDISNMSFNDLEEREEYIRNRTKLAFSYIPETEMEIIQTGLEPNYFGAKISKEGFDILINDSKVDKIYLNIEVTATTNKTISKNETTTTGAERLNVSGAGEIKKEETKSILWILTGIIVIVFIILLCIFVRRRKR